MRPLHVLRLLALAGTAAAAATASAMSAVSAQEERPRARDAGIIIGSLPTGRLNAITDVPGVRVGQVTLQRGREVNTGVTAILPHAGNPYLLRVPAAIEVGNGYGKLVGITQVRELGELESPILLTGTLNVWRVADAAVGWMLEQPGMAEVRSLNMVVGETNDGFLSDIRARPLGEGDVRKALETASTGLPEEGAVGAGTGTVAFGWKGGIGTSSRAVEGQTGSWQVGVLVQSNYGGSLRVDGIPVPLAPPAAAATASPARPAVRGVASAVAKEQPAQATSGDGSVMVVVATDAPLDARQLQRLARRALLGIGRTGSVMSHGSGDYVIAFSTVPLGPATAVAPAQPRPSLPDSAMTPLFQAAVEATEEAVLNSMLRANTVQGHRGTIHAIPVDAVQRALRDAGRLAD